VASLLTTRSSGRATRHAPCLRKARAARPAAERGRWAVWDNDLNDSSPDRTLLVGPQEFGGVLGTAVGKTASD